MESLFLWADSPHVSGLRVASLSVHLSGRFLYILLRLIPVLHPASVELRGSTVAFSWTAHCTVTLCDVARLFGQLVLIDKPTLFFAGVFRVGPWLFLPRCKDPIKHNTPVMHEGSNEEDILPLFTGLGTQRFIQRLRFLSKSSKNFTLVLYCGTFSVTVTVIFSGTWTEIQSFEISKFGSTEQHRKSGTLPLLYFYYLFACFPPKRARLVLLEISF